jgi:hypothetical protein
MSLFDWLIVGHLFADWMLQNDWMARGKQKRLLNSAIFVHCTIYTLVQLAVLWQGKLSSLAPLTYLTFVLLTFVSHWLIDAKNLAYHWTRFFHQSDQLFVRIMVDQTMHILVMASLVRFLLT